MGGRWCPRGKTSDCIEVLGLVQGCLVGGTWRRQKGLIWRASPRSRLLGKPFSRKTTRIQRKAFTVCFASGGVRISSACTPQCSTRGQGGRLQTRRFYNVSLERLRGSPLV